MGSIFSFQHSLPKGFQEASTYLFYLPAGDGAQEAPPLDAAAANLAALRPDLSTGRGAPPLGEFRPNILVTRKSTEHDLASFLDEHRKVLRERAPGLAIAKEGPCKIAKLPAHEFEFRVTLEKQRLDIAQAEKVTVRDGHAYSFICSTTNARWASDKALFESFVGGLK